jgi:hypothetical protein
MKNLLLTLLVLLSLPFLAFSQKFQNIAHETQYNGKVSSVTKYEYSIPLFDTTQVNAILEKKGKIKYFTEYTSTGRRRSTKTISSDYTLKSVFEYDKFDNALKYIRTVEGHDSPPEIIKYEYDYENKTVVIFKNNKKYKFRKYDEQNRIIVEESFVEYSNHKEIHKQEFTYKSDGTFILKAYKNGEFMGKRTAKFDSLTQIKTEFFKSPDGNRDSQTITKMDGEDIIEVLYSTYNSSYKQFNFRDAKGNLIKRYRYSTDNKMAHVYEYEINYYKP